MTPNDIEFLLHCYISPDPHPNSFSAKVKASQHYFLEQGCIELERVTEIGNVYVTTEKGRTLVKMLCDTPMPVQLWVDGKD